MSRNREDRSFPPVEPHTSSVFVEDVHEVLNGCILTNNNLNMRRKAVLHVPHTRMVDKDVLKEKGGHRNTRVGKSGCLEVKKQVCFTPPLHPHGGSFFSNAVYALHYRCRVNSVSTA